MSVHLCNRDFFLVSIYTLFDTRGHIKSIQRIKFIFSQVVDTSLHRNDDFSSFLAVYIYIYNGIRKLQYVYVTQFQNIYFMSFCCNHLSIILQVKSRIHVLYMYKYMYLNSSIHIYANIKLSFCRKTNMPEPRSHQFC